MCVLFFRGSLHKESGWELGNLADWRVGGVQASVQELLQRSKQEEGE